MKSSLVSVDRLEQIACMMGRKTSKVTLSSALCSTTSFFTSLSVGFWPRARITSPIWLTGILPSPRWSYNKNASWNSAPNLVHVKPYHFFKHTGDINAPPGLGKHEQDDKTGVDFNTIKSKKEKEKEDTSSSSSSDEEEADQEPKKKGNRSIPNRRESVDMPKLIDENWNQSKANGESKGDDGARTADVKDADALAVKDASNCDTSPTESDTSPAETDKQKHTSDDGKTKGEESVEDVNHDLELTDKQKHTSDDGKT